MNAIYGYLADCADADMAFSYFEDFVANSTSKSTIFELLDSFKVVGEILFGIFSQSNTLSVYLIKNPQKIFWLIENNTLAYSKDKNDFYDEIESIVKRTDNFDRREYYIREYRKNEYLRIAVREIIGACSFVEIMKELSQLAFALIEAALFCAKEKIKKRLSLYDDGFCVIGMGKLGNMELNFSSDIDLLFVHKDNDKSEYFNRLARELISILNDNKEGGFVYRVDMRLRPGGNVAALSLSVDEYENYYATFGQMWEKMSLTKAYPVAGDIALGDEFLKTIEPFVYKKSLDSEYIQSIRSLMFKIKKYSKKGVDNALIPANKIDIKKGTGGIREIEFIVNYFQLIYGGLNKRLRHVSTIEGLKIIKDSGYLNADFVNILGEAYLFFRKVEHKIQLLNEQQTQNLPIDRESLGVLAKKTGMTLDEFLYYYLKITDNVHNIFNSIFIRDEKIPVFGTVDDIEGYLNEYSLNNITNTAVVIKDVVRKFLAEDVKRVQIEEIFDYTFRFVKKDMFLNCVLGFSLIKPLYTVLMFKNKKLFNAFLRMLSVNLGTRLAKYPEIFEQFISDENMELNNYDKDEYEKVSLLSIFNHLLNPYNYEHKALNDFARRFIDKKVAKFDESKQLCVVGYGKIATKQLFVGSDLDLVFLSKEDSYLYTVTVQKIVKQMRKLYDVDLRLRPYGEKGSIVVDVDYLDKYFKQSARPWEKQAAQKSAVIYCGFDKTAVENIYKAFITTNPPSKKDILDMKNKIEAYKGNGYDIKSFSGGINDIEFLAQSVCFCNNLIEIGQSAIELLDIIRKNKLIDGTDMLLDAYVFYTALLNTNRIFSKGSIINDFETIEFLMGEKGLKEKTEFYKTEVKKIFNEWFF